MDQKKHKCLFCGGELKHIFADLGTCPPSNAFLQAEDLDKPELFHPLQAWVCAECLLVQGPHFKRPQDIFNHDYAYYSSYSRSWVAHAKRYVENVAKRFNLGPDSLIIEVGSNDGYLLQHAVAMGIPCLGIDPSSGAASVAQTKGIPTITDFLTTSLAAELVKNGKKADLVCGINVFAHVPSINDFVAALQMLLKPDGVMTMEFPHLLNLVKYSQFDTIYHEHYFYYTLHVVKKILEAHGMCLFDVEELQTHGGSLRVYACNSSSPLATSPKVAELLARENDEGMNRLDFYLGFQKKIDKIRYDLMTFLLNIHKDGKSIAAYGAAAKGNTLLNYCGVRSDLIPFVADASKWKQGMYLPGSRIPVVNEDRIREKKPDYVFILPWNLQEEIGEQLSYIRQWGGKFVTAIPELRVW